MRRYEIEVFNPDTGWEFFAFVTAESREAASKDVKRYIDKNRIYRVKGVKK